MAYITDEERTKISAFVNEQEMNWNVQENNNALLAMRNKQEYEKKPFPGISEEDALDAVRRGWKSFLDKKFEIKRKRENW